jgi:hypothetical protein
VKTKTEHLEVNIDDAMLDNIRAVMASKEFVKIGVLGKSQPRSDAGPSNVELAAKHEFGEGKVPQRSFLRLTAHNAGGDFQEFVNLSAPGIFKAILENRWHEILDKFGAKWVEFVHNTFESQGFGTWPALSDYTIMQRKNPKKLKLKALRESTKMLQDTGALLRSITHEVASNE